MKRLILTFVALICFCLNSKSQIVFYVDASRPNNSGDGTSWATAKKDLQEAIFLAFSNDQIWVKAGSYLPTHDPFANASPINNRDKTFSLKNGVKIYGGFDGTETNLNQRNILTNLTILSGDLGVVNVVNDNAYHVVMAVYVGGTDLDGFTITKGRATAVGQSAITLSGLTIQRYKGGGIYNTNTAANFTNCTIKENVADCEDGNDDAWGAGIFNDNCGSVFKNCIVEANNFLAGGGSFGVFGAGMLIERGTCIIDKCIFASNSSGSGFLDGSRGGALYINASSTAITNSVFYDNSSQNGAVVACGGAISNTSSFTNCTFANNTSSFAGTTFSGFAVAIFRNCILWNIAPTINSVAGRDEIVSQDSRIGFQPTFINCTIKGAIGSPITVTNAVIQNCNTNYATFVNLSDPDGADNIYRTADDGLRLQCTSPAIDAGTGNIPLVDILNLNRTTPFDLGAYEGGSINQALNTIPIVFANVQIAQNASGVTSYSNCIAQVATVESGGVYTLSGSVTAKVWIENTQPATFVKRHYEITPMFNAALASGRVTLYFKQQEFNDFNAVNLIKLPIGSTDAIGIANIQVEKRGGVSSDGTGLFNTYSGTIQTIGNNDLNIFWNVIAARWEISFDVTGFSGFFVKTQLTTLPLNLLRFTANNILGCNKLQWQTVNEINLLKFEIEKSTDGLNFNTIGVKLGVGNGSNSYNFSDCSSNLNNVFYRLKKIDNDGRITKSEILKINKKEDILINAFPNPTNDFINIYTSNDFLVNTFVKITDASGRIIKNALIVNRVQKINIQNLASGVYFFHFKNGKTLKIVR